MRLADVERASKWKPDTYMADIRAVSKPIGKGLLRMEQSDYFALQAKYRGLGDRVHEWLLPAVRWFDRKFRTNLEGCSGCAKRRAWLNRMFPD